MTAGHAPRPLDGRVALVAGATRGAGRAIAVELARAGAYVYATGRSTRANGPSEMDRPETIDETEDTIIAAGGSGRAVRVDHLDPAQVEQLIATIDTDHGRLDVLVNDIFGGDRYAGWDQRLWEHRLDHGLRMLRLGIDTHVITSHHALPLMLRTGPALLIEMTDGTAEYNADFRRGVGLYYDLIKASVERITLALAAELDTTDCTAVALTPGWLRSEHMLDQFGVTEATWRDALAEEPHFCISESPTYVGRAVAALAGDPEVARFAGTVLSSGQLAQVYGLTDTDGTRPDARRYIPEVQATGRPADDTGYR